MSSSEQQETNGGKEAQEQRIYHAREQTARQVQRQLTLPTVLAKVGALPCLYEGSMVATMHFLGGQDD